MLSRSPTFGAFNARWMDAATVARSFVPVPQYSQLAQNNSSLLLGPRGCGKTTLLKMLTRQALESWKESERSERYVEKFIAPNFEAIYIPSDVRWSFELASIGVGDELSREDSIKSQRLMVNTNTLFHLLKVVSQIVGVNREKDSLISEKLIDTWQLANTIRNLSDVRAKLQNLSAHVRGYIAAGDVKGLNKFFQEVSPTLYGHTLDGPINAIDLISSCLDDHEVPTRWAFCFDELEIAPEWLRNELLESLRSASQNVYLKLTSAPLLPSGLKTAPGAADDFKPIRLWHSHLTDPRAFCEDLTRDFLFSEFGEQALSPIAHFSRSMLGSESEDEEAEAYTEGSTEFQVFKSLASKDSSFRKNLQARAIDPDHPIPNTAAQKDQFFRKAKPIVILRNEFRSGDRGARSRKAVTVYAGIDAIYAMSEGNPRWLLGILSDLVDRDRLDERKGGRIPYADQAKILNAAARRFVGQIRATPFRSTRPPSPTAPSTLYDFIDRVGRYFHDAILGPEFVLDPVGSFVVSPGTDQAVIAEIEQLLIIGALVFVGNSSQEVPVSIIGSRFRISHILAPVFRQPLRLYRDAPLDEILDGTFSSKVSQLTFSLES